MKDMDVTSPDGIARLFGSEEGYRFARWGRPIAPVVFGTDDASLTHIKAAITQTVDVTGQKTAETDPELGSNFMWFFCSEWDEVGQVPDLDKLIPGLPALLDSLKAQDAHQYRYFAFDAEGGIKFCAVLLRLKGHIAELPVQVLITGETVKSLLLWSRQAFAEDSPIAVVRENGICIVKPGYAAVIRAAYDPVMPVAARDPSHALRLSARAGLLLKELT